MPLDPIRIVSKINKPPNETFDAFISKVSHWWPLDTHSISPNLGEPAPETVIIERFEGGKIFEISSSGENRIWGHILEYQKGKNITFSWFPGLPKHEATTVSVQFDFADDGDTIVTLVHTGWEARGEKADETRGNYLTGWADIIQSRFTTYANSI